MSINVTVHGNPVCIKRGKMVTFDGKKEFELRRKIRIQQVRQQSKRIAEEVRNKVKKEKTKQINKLGSEVQAEYKEKQNRKLTCLKQQHNGCMREFGRAFGDAEKEPDPAKVIKQLNDENRHQAELRGKNAEQRLQVEKESLETDMRKHVEDMKYARYIENVRSKLVADLSKNKVKNKRKRLVTNIKICGEVQNESGQSESMSDEDTNEEESENIEEDNNLETSTVDSDLFNLSVLNETNESIGSESLNDSINICGKEPMSYIQYKQNFGDNINNNSEPELKNELEESEENRGRCTSRMKDVHIHLPVCGKDSSKSTVTYHSHNNYKKKSKTTALKSDELVAIADSIKKIAEDYKAEKQCDDAPCAKVFKDIVDGSASLMEVEPKNNFVPVNKTKSRKHTTCNCVPRNSYCSICKSDVSYDKIKKSHDKYSLRQGISTFSDGDMLQYPTRPILTSQSVSPTKHNRRLSSSPEKPLPFRKTILSNKEDNIKQDLSSQTECLHMVHPIKVHKTTKRTSRKKPVKKRSSIHDLNYCLPIVPKNIKKIYNKPDFEVSDPSIENPNKKKSPVRDSNYYLPTKSKNVKKIYCEPDNKHAPTEKPDFQLPNVPTTVVRSEYSTSTATGTNVKCYDHFNKFSKEEVQPALVQKISKESIDVIPDDVSDVEQQYTLCKKREKEAKIRGNKALEKIKIHQDYQKLLQELPILQRQQRLANMPQHNPSSHMSNERYQEYKRKKQNVMENKFENMQVKAVQFNAPPVTLKSVQKSPPSKNDNAPLKTLDITDENAVLNVGNWEKVNLATCSNLTCSNSDEPCDKASEDTIADLLKRVNKQRELLLKEAVSMKSLGSLKDILNEEELINIICNCPPRQKVLVETGTSPLSKLSGSECPTTQRSYQSKSPKRSAISSSDTSVDICKPKTPKIKPKGKKFKIYLREEATQTSPALSSSKSIGVLGVDKREDFTQTSRVSYSTSSQKSKVRRSKSQRSQSSAKSLVVSKSAPQPSSSDKSDQVCEIIIRTGDQNVKINPLICPTTASGTKKDTPKKDLVIKIKGGKGDGPQKNALEISTSTSYLSPPVFENKTKATHGIGTARSSNRHLLQPQRQQTNMDNLVKVENGSKEVNPRLIRYIMRLLNMSRQSIDDLTISSVSDVSTPQDSVIQTANNIAKEKLQTVMDHFNLSADDIKRFCLSSSSLSDLTNQEMKTHDKKHFVSVSTSTQQYEDEQVPSVAMNENKSTSPDNKRLRGTDTRDTGASTSSGYIASKSRTPRSSATQKKEAINDKSKDTSSQKQTSSSPTSDFRPSSPKSTTIRSTTPPINTCVKIALPKFDSTSEQCSTDLNVQPSSIKQTNIQKLSPTKSSYKSPKQEIISKHGTSETSSEEMLKNPEKFLQFVRESLGMTVEEFSELGFEEMFSRHMELTEYCHDRIRSLMSLIEQIRNEKRDICALSSPIDPSMTSYMELPPSKSKLTSVKNTDDQEYGACVQSCLENEVSSSSSISQDAIDQYLLGIESDVELRGKKGKKEENQDEQSSEKRRLQSGANKESEQSFIPILQGIPKFTESNVVDAKNPSFLGNLIDQTRSKPPPALLRSNMRGHTNDIPHELSTIVEADTVLSSRNTSAYRPRSSEARIRSKDISLIPVLSSPDKKSPSKKLEMNKSANMSHSTNSSAEYVTITPEKIISNESKKGQTKSVKSVMYNTSDSTPENDTGTKSALSGIRSLSETSQETPDELEALLRKFKLEWAISLVKKTERALALSSSSSSSDVRGKKDGSSDVSLKDSFKHLCKKLASLNESDIERAQIVTDLSQHFREFHDISEIPGVADSKNKSHQRTSTPVQHSKSGDSKKSNTNESLFKVDSELSSVRNTSDETHEQLFLSIPNITLNTEHISLIKS